MDQTPAYFSMHPKKLSKQMEKEQLTFKHPQTTQGDALWL